MNKLKSFLTFSLVITSIYAFGQYCTQDNRFSNSEFFSNDQIDRLENVNYANAQDLKGESQDLLMDIFFPKKSEDNLEKRPLILLIHGGGFMSGNKEQMTFMSKEFAKRGFVSAAMSYRLGIEPDPSGYAKALYRAQQDANAALRYLVKNSENLGVDVEWIFIGGASAGAFTSLISAYGQQEEWDAGFPDLGVLLGSLNASGNDIDTSFSIKGIYNHMGAISPLVLDNDELVPTISFHGDNDSTVPIDVSQMGFGSRALHNNLTSQSVCNEITIVSGGEHDIYWSNEGNQFMAGKASTFFKSIFCDSCTSAEFIDSTDANNEDISSEILEAIKLGDIEKLDAMIGEETLDECHKIRGGLYNYLAFSIKLESFESLQYFVNKKADLEGNCTGKTPLMYAAKYGQFDALKLLLENGADLNATNEGKTALDYAINYNHEEIKEYLEEYKSE